MTPTTDRRRAKAAARQTRGSLKGEVYRQARLWHGWLSAFAFLALIFFALTGLLLNHPEWFKSDAEPKPAETTIMLSKAELSGAKAATDPHRALADAVARHTPLVGGYQSGETVDNEVLIRTEGVRGASDVTVNLDTGETQVSSERARLVTTLNDLHRGKNAGAVWKLVIDASAIVVLALSLIGYVLFFSLRFRLRTSLILTGISLAVLIAAFCLLTP